MATFPGGQTYKTGSAGNIKLPNVPQAQLSTPFAPVQPDWSYFGDTAAGAPDPFDYFRFKNQAIKEGMQAYPGLVNMQLQQLPNITNAYLQASQQAFPTVLSQQQRASQAAFEEQMRQYGIAAPQIGAQNWSLMQQYAPQYANLMRQEGQKTADQYQRQAQQYDPEFFKTYGALGGRINEGLAAGHDLGSDLEREVQQSIRASQTARGNYLGPAATAAEAYGLGHEAQDLYNTRIGQAQNFLQGKQPTDLWNTMQGQYGPATASMGMVGQTAQPNVGMISPVVSQTAGPMTRAGALAGYQNPYTDYATQGGQAYSTYMGAQGTYSGQNLQSQAQYNDALIRSASANNEGTFNMYDKQFEQFLFDQGVSQGIYSQPTGSSGVGSMLGSGLGALGSIGGGLASAGVFGGGAGAAGSTLAGTGIASAAAGLGGTAGGLGGAIAGVGGAIAGGVSAVGGAIGAAASAAAAAFACWLARAVMPERWREFRKFLFTKAPAWFRRKYLYGARRFVNGLTEADKAQIREVMEKCLK